MNLRRKPLSAMAVFLVMASVLAACSKDKDTGSSPSTGGSATVPTISLDSFTSDFSAMAALKPLAGQLKGLVGVLLPDTTTSTRYVQYDAPMLKQAFEAAGMTDAQFKIDNAQGSTATMQQQAEADITAGASVLLLDAIDSGSGAAIEANAVSKGVKVIDYDRLTLGGPADRVYVSFDNVTVGKTIGQGLIDCITAWNVQKPNILIMDGDPTDNNAKLFAQGYNEVLKPKFDDGSYVKVGEPAGTWDGPTAATNFETQYTAHPNINATINPNDNVAGAVIAILKKDKIPANTFPTTGQDASTPGMQNILTGYQCGTVYKPVYLEAQAAAAVALYLGSGNTPPATLVNATTEDSTTNSQVDSVYTTPVWVTSDNMEDTVIKDGAVKASEICTGPVVAACTAAGIS
jgi:D-xylose transport system substrate-binding protein